MWVSARYSNRFSTLRHYICCMVRAFTISKELFLFSPQPSSKHMMEDLKKPVIRLTTSHPPPGITSLLLFTWLLSEHNGSRELYKHSIMDPLYFSIVIRNFSFHLAKRSRCVTSFELENCISSNWYDKKNRKSALWCRFFVSNYDVTPIIPNIKLTRLERISRWFSQ